MPRVAFRRALVTAAAFLLVTTAATIHPSRALAQADPERQSAIGTRWRDFGGFGGLTLRFGDFDGEFAAFPGAELAVLLKRRVYLGLAGAGLATEHPLDTGSPPSKLEMGYGGVLVGFIVPTRTLVQITTQALIGAGGVRGSDVPGADWDAVFLFEPSVGLELKLAPIARLGLGLGYRYVGGSDLAAMPDDELRGVTGTVTLRLGWF